MSALADEPAGGVHVLQEQRIAELQAQLDLAERRHAVLRRAEALRDRLLAVAVAGGDAAALARTTAELVGRPCAVTGAGLVPVAGHDPVAAGRWTPELAAPRLRQDPTVQEILRTLGKTQEALLPPVLHLDARHRLLVGAPTSSGARVWLAERPSGFTALDRLAVRHATTALALLEGGGQEARHDVAAELLAGTGLPAGLERAARHAGLDPAFGVVVLCVPPPATAVLSALTAADRPVLALERPEGVALLVGADPDLLPDEARAAVMAVVGDDVAASALVHDVTALPGAWTEARTIAAAHAVVGADPAACAALGPARLLLGTGDRAALDAFVHETLGALLDAEGADAFLTTLAASFDALHSVGRTAEALGVHENTVRYRLKRAEERLGRDLGRAEERLAVEVAILVLRLRGDARVAPQNCR